MDPGARRDALADPRFVRLGFAVTTAGLAGMLLVLDPDVPWPVAIVAFGVAGLGMGLAYSPLALIVLREAPPEAQGTVDLRPVADRLARHGARHRPGRRPRRGQPADDRRPGSRAGRGIRARRVAIGLGGLVLDRAAAAHGPCRRVARDGVGAPPS